MAQQVIKPFRARTMRLTRLLSCCTSPASGTACSTVVLDGFITVTLSADVEEGEEFFQKKASGDICINEKLPDVLKRFNVGLELCEMGPDVVNFLTSWPIVEDAASGHVGFDLIEGINSGTVALELWTGIAGQVCSGDERFGYLLVPCLNGAQLDGDLPFGLEPTNMSISAYTSSSHAWGGTAPDEVGPYAVQGTVGSETTLVTPLASGTHARLMTTQVPPPSVTDGCIAMPAS